MEKTLPKIEFVPTERRDQSGWYVQVVFHFAPPFQLGGFKTEQEAKDWIKQNSAQWLNSHGGEGRYA
jgi:hypothetical protein